MQPVRNSKGLVPQSKDSSKNAEKSVYGVKDRGKDEILRDVAVQGGDRTKQRKLLK